MGRLRQTSFALGQITVSASLMFGSVASASTSTLQVTMPKGFEDLAAARRILVDVYFGGEKIGEALAASAPGHLTFEDPVQVAGLLPSVSAPPIILAALSNALPSNVSLVCRKSQHENCGKLFPDQLGIIFDEERFRVDVFVHPSLLAAARAAPPAYLGEPEFQPALISLFGATVSGSGGGGRNFHVQNRSMASLGMFRLQSDSSVATGSGLSFDNLSLQTDRREWRYIGGLFWAPGSELVGRRKIAGVGLATQLDTRRDKRALQGNPLTIFLQQPSRVELLLDGRIISSRIHSAGHQLLDTVALPNGSYDVEIRIQEPGQPVRSERRFFSKGAAMAPIGEPQFSAFAGLLQTSSRGPIINDGIGFFQASAGYRVSPGLGLDATVVATQRKLIMEGGAVVSTPHADIRVVGLASSDRDFGAVVRVTSSGSGPLAASVDLRAVDSRDGKPLLPLSNSKGTFNEDPLRGLGVSGSYFQSTAIVDYRFRAAAVRFSGTYRRSGEQKPTYNIGASLEVPVVRQARWDVRVQADVRKTEHDAGSFLGMRFLMTGGPMALSGRSGVSRVSGDRRRSVKFIGETQAAWQHQLDDSSQLSTEVGFGRDADGGYGRASGYLRSPALNARADILRQFGDESGTTQFTATADAAFVMNKSHFSISAANVTDAAAIVSVTGGSPGDEYQVLVDDVVRGAVRDGSSLTLFLPPYETYEVSLRPGKSSLSTMAAETRHATLYPGNVARLEWTLAPLSILFARAVDRSGRPVSDADVRGEHGIARTDEAGYFQIEVAATDSLEIRTAEGQVCSLDPPAKTASAGYISGGDLTCH